ncbi:partial 4-diphosphocytidyl-2-C-methyl-D-erythritol kinase, partial [Geobacteraceae bacterium]
ALLSLSGREAGIDIAITKNIPVAAGLGGGSSDAATVLLGVNELLGLGLSTERLMEIGVTLGADVPFFVFGKNALAEGIGEILTVIESVPPLWLVIVNPNIPVSTVWVYQSLQLTGERNGDTIPRFFKGLDDVCAVLSNDLEPVTIGKYPVIGEIKERLIAEGAAGALMSGSGPTVFGLFEVEEEARRAARSMARAVDWFVTTVRALV